MIKSYAGTTFPIDPMLAKEHLPPGFEGTHRSNLRQSDGGITRIGRGRHFRSDAVIVTHTHLDHWDDAAQKHCQKTFRCLHNRG